AEREARQQSKDQRDQQDGPVDFDFAHARQAQRRDGAKRIHSPGGQQQPERAAECSQQQTFGQQLPDQSAPAGAEREQNGEFLSPLRVARQQQVRQIRARDQQHKQDGELQRQHRRPIFSQPRQRVAQSRQLNRQFGVARRFL